MFDGKTYNPMLDRERLKRQIGRVFEIMRGGRWRTLDQIVAASRSLYGGNDSEAGVSARLRDLRKPKFGAHDVERRRTKRSGGQYEYRLIINPGVQTDAFDDPPPPFGRGGRFVIRRFSRRAFDCGIASPDIRR